MLYAYHSTLYASLFRTFLKTPTKAVESVGVSSRLFKFNRLINFRKNDNFIESLKIRRIDRLENGNLFVGFCHHFKVVSVITRSIHF